MGLSFLPEAVKSSIAHLNYNLLSEIRLRFGQPVVIEYSGRKSFLGAAGLSCGERDRIFCGELAETVNRATGGCIYNYTEQMKNGFFTVGHGVRIGVAGEYVTENGRVSTIKCITSLNVRIPHDVTDCARKVCESLFKEGVRSTLIFSAPGLGKTTMLRDVARKLGKGCEVNVLVLDERNEIAAIDGFGEGFNLGSCDVVRCFNKRGAIASAIRAMKPDVIITDELYGDDDMSAVKYAADCGITVIASTHVTDREILKKTPFDYFVRLTSVGGQPEIYDKNFNTCRDNGAYDDVGSLPFGK